MWLEELVWVWGPLVGGVGLWCVWSLVALKAEVKALRRRMAHLENQNEKRHDKMQRAA